MTITITLTAIISNFIVVVGARREYIYLFQMFWVSKLETRVSVCVCVCLLLSQCQVQSARKKTSIDLTQFLAKCRYPSSPSSLYANTYVRRINSRVFLTYISLEEKCISRKLKSNRKQLHKFKEMERVWKRKREVRERGRGRREKTYNTWSRA